MPSSSSKSLTEARFHQIEDCDLIDNAVRDAARKTVAHAAVDAEECVDFLRMLGIHSSQDGELVPRLATATLVTGPAGRTPNLPNLP